MAKNLKICILSIVGLPTAAKLLRTLLLNPTNRLPKCFHQQLPVERVIKQLAQIQQGNKNRAGTKNKSLLEDWRFVEAIRNENSWALRFDDSGEEVLVEDTSENSSLMDPNVWGIGWYCLPRIPNNVQRGSFTLYGDTTTIQCAGDRSKKFVLYSEVYVDNNLTFSSKALIKVLDSGHCHAF